MDRAWGELVILMGQGEKLRLRRKNPFLETPGVTTCTKICCAKGSGTMDVLIIGAIIIFVLLPVFSAIMERYMLLVKVQAIKDAVDLTNLSSYFAMETEILGKGDVSFDEDKLLGKYKEMLAKNLRLDDGLNPEEGSIADCQVRIESVVLYSEYNEDFPASCPEGASIMRPAVHSSIVVPVKPVFFAGIIKSLSGKEYIELKVHVDSDIPINN